MKAEVESKVEDVKKALETDDKARIVSATEALQQALSVLGQAAYQQQPGQPQPQTNGTNGTNGHSEKSGDDENVVEGEFTEA